MGLDDFIKPKKDETIVGVLKKLEQAIKDKQEPRKARSVHPSGIYYCSRSLVYSQLFEAKPPTVALSKIFDDGNVRHERILNLFKEAGLIGDRDNMRADLMFAQDWDKRELIEAVLRVDMYGANGRIDGIIDYENKMYPLEIKGINQNGFRRILHKPDTAHVWQLNYYMYRLGMDKGILFYECKDNQAWKGYLIAKDDKLVDKIKAKMLYVKEHVDNETIPPRPYAMKDSTCINCAWCGRCWS